MPKLILTDVQNLQNESTVVTQLKGNNDSTELAMEATLSRDGQSPNQMLSNLDMNNYKIINLPDALTDQEPATYSQLVDMTTAIGNGAVVNASYVTLGTNPSLLSERVLTGSNDISVTDGGAGGNVIVDVIPSTLRQTLSIDNTDNTSDATKNAAVATLTNKTIDTAGPNTIRINGNTLAASSGSATVTVPNTTDTLVGRNTTDTLTNKSISGSSNTLTNVPISTAISGLAAGVATFLATPSSANLKTAVTDETGTGGALVFATSPTLTTPVISSITNTGTLTLPTTTDTLVGKITTDTFQNKTISGSNNTLSNIANGSLTNSTITVGTVSTALGGTLSAATGRGSTALNIDSATGHGDSAYTILATDRHVFTNAAFTASRTWTLPAANAVNAGQRILIGDLQGTVSATNTLIIAAGGTDTINGVAAITLSTASTSLEVISDGTSKWYAVQSGSGGGGGGGAGSVAKSYEFVATAAQTSFSGTDQNSKTLLYTVGNVQVYLNGTRLNIADFTATTGSTVVLATGANVGDLVTIVDFGSGGGSSFSQYEYNATASQTTFSGADVNSKTLTYAVGFLLVYVNGDLLNQADYTATNGTSVVFAVGRTLNDQVKIISMNQSAVALIPTNNLSDVTSVNTSRQNLGLPGILRGYLSGLTMSTAGSSTTLTIAAGVANDSTFTDFMSLGSSLNKTTSAWAVGSGNGGMDTGSVAASTWYHFFLIKRPDTGVVDVVFSLSATTPTLPTNYTIFRRIGSMLTNGSSQWTLFHQLGDEFLWDAIVTDVASQNSVNGSLLHALTVPSNIQVYAQYSLRANFSTAGCLFLVSSPDTAAPTTGGAVGQAVTASGVTIEFIFGLVRTDTSREIRVTGNATGSNYSVITQGWIDTRGKL